MATLLRYFPYFKENKMQKKKKKKDKLFKYQTYVLLKFAEVLEQLTKVPIIYRLLTMTSSKGGDIVQKLKWNSSNCKNWIILSLIPS